MNCKLLRMTIENLTLSSLRSKKYTDLHSHARRCRRCGKMWEQWLRREEQLASLLSTAQAPAVLGEKVMAELIEAETIVGIEPASLDVYLEISPKGIRRLELRSSAEVRSDKPRIICEDAGLASVGLAHRQLAEYFGGERAFFQLSVDLRHCSTFERSVLQAVSEIPYGEVRSYKWVAEQVGRPRAWRGVGRALHNNPAPIVIPCHRVVRSDGSPGGYAFGEAWKTRLLGLEESSVPLVGCSSTRILCYRGCRRERSVREGNRIHFARLDDALESGYRPCKVCKPA